MGGGAYCSTASSVISNCVLTGNVAYFWGGGAIYGSLNKCVIENNTRRFRWRHLPVQTV